MKTATQYVFKDLPRAYAELVEILPPRPIHGDGDYDEVREMLDALVGHKLNKDQTDYVAALKTFFSAYERDRYPIDTSGITPLESLKAMMADHGMTASDLARLLDVGKSAASMILGGRRGLSKANIKKLCEQFKVSTDLFLD